MGGLKCERLKLSAFQLFSFSAFCFAPSCRGQPALGEDLGNLTVASQSASKKLPNGPANTGKTVETVKKLRDPDPTPLKRAEAGC